MAATLGFADQYKNKTPDQARQAYALSHPTWIGVGTPWLAPVDPYQAPTGGEGHAVPAGATGLSTGPPAGTLATTPDPNDPYGAKTMATNVGIGERPTPITPPTLGTAPQATAPPTITAPTVEAAQGGFDDFDAMQRAMYESAYMPVERELSRQQGLADTKLNAMLAQAGISSSGTGINARERQATEYAVRKASAATDAANQAAVTRYGLQYQQSMENAKLRQEASLANAGYSMAAQVSNAQNILTLNLQNAQLMNSRDLAQAQLYLETMGLNVQQAYQAKQSVLAYLGLQEQDLARMDALKLENLSQFYNFYLKQLAILGQTGQVSFDKGDAGGSGFDFGL